MRLTVAMNVNELARVQCFVGDPAMAVGGSRRRRSSLMCRIVVFWLALGTRLAWKKGQRGQVAEWIGAAFKPWQAAQAKRGVRVGIMPHSVTKLQEMCTRLAQLGSRISRAEVRQLAGLATWLSGLMPQMSAFTRLLWAAVASSDNHTVALTQVQTPVAWLTAFAFQEFAPLERRCRR